MLAWLSPYPDETLGSVFIRLRRRTGLPFSFLKRELAIPEHSHIGLIQARWVAQFSEVTRKTPEDVVLHHTLIPYATSTTSLEQTQEAIRRAVRGQDSLKDLGRLANAMEGQPFYRYCEQCASADKAHLGETYWRRVHQLPGVYACPWHREPLVGVSSRPFRRIVPDLMPADLQTNITRLPVWKHQTYIAALSAEALSGGKLRFKELVDSAEEGRFIEDNGALSTRLNEEFVRFYDKEFLIAAKMTSNSLGHWIKAQLHPSRNTFRTPLRYVLLKIFCELSQTVIPGAGETRANAPYQLNLFQG